MNEDLLKMKGMIDSIYPVPEKDMDDFYALWIPGSAKRKEILTVAGEPEVYLYFITQGVQRIYYYDDEGREATLVFTYAPSFGGVLDALTLQVPSKYYYETLTASTFLKASYQELEKLMGKHPAIERMIRLGISQSLSGVLERLVELQCYSSEERFRKLLQRSPHILQLVPHKYLANYLGIDATNFSKLINKVKV
jgi:CRP-like cAMP-binding protein